MKYILFCSLLLLFSSLRAQKLKITDTTMSRIITTDIDNFWFMYERLKTAKSEKDTLKILKEYYLDKASLGLKEYLEEVEVKQNRKSIEAEYLKMLRQYPKYLASMKQPTKEINHNKQSIYQALSQLKKLYPECEIAETYLGIGFTNTTGTRLKSGKLYIGAEVTVTSEKVNTTEFVSNKWLIEDALPANRVYEVVIHENLHAQQPLLNQGCCSLLCQALLEGAAVLVVELLTNGEGLIGPAGVAKDVYEIGESREKEVWIDFKNDMAKDDKSQWFLNDNGKYPFSMGYYVGYKICKSYYDNATDKKSALKHIIEMTNCESFLKESKYEEKLK
jgi:hypothetical protein